MLMIGKQLTAQQRLQKGLTAIIGHEYFAALNGVLMVLNHRVQSTTEPKVTRTAMTNGINVTYAEEFIEELSDAELRFLILHETYHCMFKHLTTWEWMFREDAQSANEACDHVVNLMLLAAAAEIERGFISMPEVGLADPQYTGMNAAEVYHKIRKDKQEQPQGGQGQGQGQGGQGQGQGQGGQQGQSQGFDDHDWEGAADMSNEEKDANERALDEAVRQGALLAGKLGTGGLRDINELLKTKVRWQDVLREYLHTVCTGSDFSTWRRPNRRFISSGVYMPSGVSMTIGEIVVGVDMSGSIGSREAAQFLGEIQAIAQTVRPEAVRILYWDTQVVRAERYAQDELDTIVSKTKPAGGGGTDPGCVPRYLNENNVKAQVCVMLTDGYTGDMWGTGWPCPVMWCIVGNSHAKPNNGEAVHIDWND